MTEAAVAGVRHPHDPDPIPSTKSWTVLGLGIVALLTGPLLGGVIPATVALILARETGRDLKDAQGFLLGGRRTRIGVQLAWAGILLALTALFAAAIAGLLTFAHIPSGDDVSATVN